MKVQGGHKKGNPLLAAILKYFLEVINFSVYIFGQFRFFYVSGEEIVDKYARMSLISPCPYHGWVFGRFWQKN